MAGDYAGIVVSTAWLVRSLKCSDDNLCLLDASWTRTKCGHEDFISKHIPGAIFFDLNRCVTPTPTVPRNLPNIGEFEEYVRSLGISSDTHIVVYDRTNLAPSARVWWTFRAFGHKSVSVLDGGFLNWESNGFLVQGGDASINVKKIGDFKVHLDPSLIRNYEDMAKILATRSTPVLDTRAPEVFHGDLPEPVLIIREALQGMHQPMPSKIHCGHMPGARNLDYNLLVKPDTQLLLTPAMLKQMFQAAGVDLSQPLITTCYIGHTACLMALAAALCGKLDTAVYYGSWTEYGQRAENSQVEVGCVDQLDE